MYLLSLLRHHFWIKVLFKRKKSYWPKPILVVCLFSCLWPFFYFIINWFLLVVLFHNNWAVFPQRFLSRWLRPDLCAPSLIPSLSLTLKQSARTLASTSVWTLFRNKNLYCNLAQIFIWLPFRVFRGWQASHDHHWAQHGWQELLHPTGCSGDNHGTAGILCSCQRGISGHCRRHICQVTSPCQTPPSS